MSVLSKDSIISVPNVWVVGPRWATAALSMMRGELKRWSQRHCCCVQSIFLCQRFRNSFVTMELETIFHVKHFKMSHYNCHSPSKGWVFVEQKEQRRSAFEHQPEQAEASPPSGADGYFSSHSCLGRPRLRQEITLQFPYPRDSHGLEGEVSLPTLEPLVYSLCPCHLKLQPTLSDLMLFVSELGFTWNQGPQSGILLLLLRLTLRPLRMAGLPCLLQNTMENG